MVVVEVVVVDDEEDVIALWAVVVGGLYGSMGLDVGIGAGTVVVGGYVVSVVAGS